MKKTILATLFFSLIFVWGQAQEARATYHDNGNKKSQGNVQKGKKVGEWTFYYDNAQVMRQGVYKNDKPLGEWKEYYRNGTIKSEMTFVEAGGESKKHGDYKTYHKNGSVHFDGAYKYGKKVGKWIEYNKLGIILKEYKY